PAFIKRLLHVLEVGLLFFNFGLLLLELCLLLLHFFSRWRLRDGRSCRSTAATRFRAAAGCAYFLDSHLVTIARFHLDCQKFSGRSNATQVCWGAVRCGYEQGVGSDIWHSRMQEMSLFVSLHRVISF